MKLAASLIVRNEIDRYLPECLDHLEEFCDMIVVWDDASDDGTFDYLLDRVRRPGSRVRVHNMAHSEPLFFEHEGKARQWLLQSTLAWSPTHVLAIDADEFVADGQKLRKALTVNPDVWSGETGLWSLSMEEVWELDGDCVCIRSDGAWVSHEVPMVFRVDDDAKTTWRIQDRKLACGRVPVDLTNRVRAVATGTELLHFGWAHEGERKARAARYAIHDGGRFHRSEHLDSILWDSSRVRLRGREWPDALGGVRDRLTATVGGTDAAREEQDAKREQPARHRA